MLSAGGKKPKKEVLEPMYFFLRDKYLVMLNQTVHQAMTTTSDDMVSTSVVLFFGNKVICTCISV